jgi:cytochrome c2
MKNEKWLGYRSELLLILLLPFAWLSINSCKQKTNKEIPAQSEGSSDSSSNGKEIYIDLKKVLGNPGEKVTDVTVKYDAFFKTAKKYKGYYLNTIVDSVIKSEHFDTGHAVIIFECIDGYKPSMDLSKIYGDAKGFIVFKDLDSGVKRNWPDSVEKIFAPYYLVWDDVKKEDNSFVWPYGLTGLSLVPRDQEYKNIYPYNDSSLVKGFILFRENCMKCHSINKTGGTMAPEFNFPKNITEYWKEEDIISFAKNPVSYRYNSRMSPITNVSDADFTEIIKFIKSMKGRH